MEEDQTQTKTQVPTPSSPRSQCSLERNDNNQPVRSRWTPKPEQILILESIFNSGMVNPPKEETIKIRKLLEKFGSVGDANVFYWFQNRRSRSRRRQRQIQASLMTGGGGGGGGGSGGGAIEYQDSSIYAAQTPGFHIQQPSFFSLSGGSSTSSSPSSSSSRPGGPEEIYSVSGQSGGFHEQITSMPSNFLHLDTSKVHYEFGLGVITVFINGVPTELESGPVNMKAMFGEDLMLVHSSGVPMPLDEYGVLVSGLQHGESYFLVSRSI